MSRMSLSAHWVDFFLPTTCASCNVPLQEGANLCERCYHNLTYPADFRCSQCGARCPNGTTHHSGSLSILAAAPFNAPGTAELIHRLKFSRTKNSATSIGLLLANALLRHKNIISSFVLAPIPLSPTRLRQRGYNQAELIAKQISYHTKLPVLDNALIRAIHTNPQTEMKTEEREQNVAGVFQARPSVAGEKIILIDDVVTTGATLLSAARALRLAHARPVIAAVFAASPYSPVCPQKSG